MLNRHDNAFRITGPLWEESAVERWVALKKSVMLSFDFCKPEQYVQQTVKLFMIDLRRHYSHVASL